MDLTEEYMQSRIKKHLFYIRILKEEAIFIEFLLPQLNDEEIVALENLKLEYELLMEKLLALYNNESNEVDRSSDLLTPYTYRSELLFQFFTGIPIGTTLTKREEEALKSNRIVNEPSKSLEEVNEKCVSLAKEQRTVFSNILTKISDCNLMERLQQYIDEITCYLHLIESGKEEADLWKERSTKDGANSDSSTTFPAYIKAVLEDKKNRSVANLQLDHLLRKVNHYEHLANKDEEKKTAALKCATVGEWEVKIPDTPSVISASPSLKISRWTSFRRITHFARDAMPVINNIRMSANAEKIAISTYGGTYVINGDGTNLIRLSDKRNEGLIDISADGSKVVWYDGYNEGYMSVNGGEKSQLAGKFTVYSVRISADGEQIYVLSPQYKGGGIFRLAASEAGIQKVVNTKDVASLGYADENANHWRGWPSGIDLSDDGRRIVFQFLTEGYAVNSDGSDLHIITKERDPKDYLYHIQISGDGNRIVRNYQGPDSASLVFGNWEGGYTNIQKGKTTHGNKVAECSSLQLTKDGAWAAMSWGYRIFSATNQNSLDVSDFGLAGDEPKPLDRISVLSIDATGKKACLLLDQGPQQLVMAELNPKTIEGVPQLMNMSIIPTKLYNDGSNNAIASAVPIANDLQYVGVSEFQDGWRIDVYGWPNARLLDEGNNGDEKKGDGIFATSNLRISYYPPLPEMALTSRFFAFTKEGDCIAVDLEGLQIVKP